MKKTVCASPHPRLREMLPAVRTAAAAIDAELGNPPRPRPAGG
jgi:hypothetical protein